MSTAAAPQQRSWLDALRDPKVRRGLVLPVVLILSWDLLTRFQLVNTRLLVTTQHGVTLIPSYAIQHNGEVAFVYVIQKGTSRDGKPQLTAHVRNVKEGTTDAGMTAVQGVNPDEMLATSSYEKLQDGAPVIISKQPTSQNPNAESSAP